jgi:hypothetical protein
LEIAPEGGQGQAYGPGTTRVALAFGVTRLISTFLFGVKPTDPLTYAAVALGLAAIAFAGLLRSGAPRAAGRSDGRCALRIELIFREVCQL